MPKDEAEPQPAVDDDNYYDDLLHRCQKIEDMAATEGWTLLVDRAKATIAPKQNKIAFGGCTDHEDYIRETEYVKGMQFVLALPATVRSSVNEFRRQRAEDRPVDDDE